jgi:hypothetical protein
LASVNVATPVVLVVLVSDGVAAVVRVRTTVAPLVPATTAVSEELGAATMSVSVTVAGESVKLTDLVAVVVDSVTDVLDVL